MGKQFWLQSGDDVFGPYTAAQLRDLSAEKRIKRGDLVREDDDEEWRPVETLKGLTRQNGEGSEVDSVELPPIRQEWTGLPKAGPERNEWVVPPKPATSEPVVRAEPEAFPPQPQPGFPTFVEITAITWSVAGVTICCLSVFGFIGEWQEDSFRFKTSLPKALSSNVGMFFSGMTICWFSALLWIVMRAVGRSAGICSALRAWLRSKSREADARARTLGG